MPGSVAGAEVWPIKLVASMVFLIAGVSLLTIEVLDPRPDAYFDPIRREVRVSAKERKWTSADGSAPRLRKLIGRCTISQDDEVELFDVDGSLF